MWLVGWLVGRSVGVGCCLVRREGEGDGGMDGGREEGRKGGRDYYPENILDGMYGILCDLRFVSRDWWLEKNGIYDGGLPGFSFLVRRFADMPSRAERGETRTCDSCYRHIVPDHFVPSGSLMCA